jgi:PAS domain S-box-containing protein
MGDILLATLLLVWSRAANVWPERERLAEAVALLAAAAFVAIVVFAGPPAMVPRLYPLHYAAFPIIVWGALRFGQLGTTTVTFVVSSIAIASTAAGLGPFASSTAHESLLLLQFFMAVVAATGLLLGAAIAERDHAERRRAANYAALEVSASRLALALDAGSMGVWDWDLRTGKIQWSDNLEPLVGLPPGGFEGTLASFQALVHPDDRARVDEAIARAVAEGASYDVEFRSIPPDGAVRWLAAKGAVLRDPTGTPVRMLGVGMDMTTRRRLEEELREHAAELADADRRKDEFLAMLAHELRNPLTPLSLSLRLLRFDGPERERSLDIAERQVKHLVRLVDDLLDVSRITRGKITLRRDPVLLGEVFDRALELSRPLVESRGHALRVSLPAETLRIDGDAVRLTQVFANLLDNAAKYTPASGTIWLTAERAADHVVVRVRDTGVGLGSDLVPRIFDLFVQGDSSLDRSHGGLGIGLTVVRRLVELHGGRVEARSGGAGKGSEFVVHLPAGPSTPCEAVAPGDAAHTLRPLRILIVEDHEDAADSLATTLGLLGHEARIALDGPRALALIETFAPEVVISDLGLPGMDGFELCRQLRERPGLGQVLLIALSGYGRDEDRSRALDAGFDHHLVKPPDMNQLLTLLARAADAPGAGPRTLH